MQGWVVGWGGWGEEGWGGRCKPICPAPRQGGQQVPAMVVSTCGGGLPSSSSLPVPESLREGGENLLE